MTAGRVGVFDEGTALLESQQLPKTPAVEDMAAVGHSELPQVVGEIVAVLALRPVVAFFLEQLVLTLRAESLVIEVGIDAGTAAVVLGTVLVELAHDDGCQDAGE
jgi:hypothetical protein